MKMQEIREIAKQNGLSAGKMNKCECIRAIQKFEDNSPCFNTGKVDKCGQMSCLWREDCQ